MSGFHSVPRTEDLLPSDQEDQRPTGAGSYPGAAAPTGWRPYRPVLLWLGVGLVTGLVLSGLWPQTPLHATATDRYDTFAIATGAVDEDLEAVYFLDFLTGDLRAAVLGRQSGKFTGFYEYNILKDLGVDPAKNPRYLMVTGVADLVRGAARNRPSRAAVYVAEITTGVVAAYTIPWNQQSYAANIPFKGTLWLMDVMRFRTAAIRGERSEEKPAGP